MLTAARMGFLAVVLAMVCGASQAADDPSSTTETATAQAQSSPPAADPANQAGAGSSAEKPPQSHLDRRDRVFYPGDTEHPRALGRKLLLNMALDQEEFFTSPFHMNRHNAWEWITTGAVTGGLVVGDHHIAALFENSRGQVRWGGRISNIGASYTLIPIIGGSYFYGAWRDNAKAREIGVLGTESLLDSLIVVGVLKEVFRRNRPDEKHPGDFWGGGSSFPSGHTIQIWSVASLLAHEYKHHPVVGVTAYSLAGIVSAARIAAQKHFASDVFAGGTMGWFIGRYVYQTHMSHLSHRHSFLIPTIVPQIEPSQRVYAFTLTLGGSRPAMNLIPTARDRATSFFLHPALNAAPSP